jgi:hypothetical protein
VVTVPDDAGAGVPPVCPTELPEVEVPVCVCETEVDVDVVVPSGLVLGDVVVAAGSSVAAGVVVAG